MHDPTTTDLYQEVLLDLARHPHGYGALAAAEQIFPGTNASCGDEIQWYVEFDASGQRLKKLQWTGQGCIISQAAMSVVVDLALGKTLAELKQLRDQDLEEALGIEQISPGRIKCLTLGLRTLVRGWSARKLDQDQAKEN